MLKKLNDAMDYIEAHLEDEFLLEKISEHINVSDYHFRKIFFALTNMTLNEYVKNRRLSEANKELLQGAQVTDVAYQYGYQSVDGFTRAFKKWSGILPSQVAKLKQCKSCQKLQFVVTMKGGTLMEYKILEEAGELTHLIGVLTTKNDISSNLDTFPVKAHTWAVFPNEGIFPFTLQDTMARIYSEWFMTADYELAEPFSFSFTKMDDKKPNYAYSEIWIPVTKKE